VPAQRADRNFGALHLYKKRQSSIESVFGNIKARGYRRFARRGLAAVNREWRLICATHNLIKLWRVAPVG